MTQTFLDKVKSAASSFAGNAKAAGQIAAKQAERTKITQVTLPSAYLTLGTGIHGVGRFRDEFGDRYAKADDLLARIAKLRAAQPAPSEPQKFTDRAKAAAGHAKDLATAKALEVQVHSVLRELGKSAFEKHGDQSGPSELTKPIADALSRIAAIDAEISQISESHKGGFLTPKRVLFGGVAVIGLVLLLVARSMFSGGTTSNLHERSWDKLTEFAHTTGSNATYKTAFLHGDKLLAVFQYLTSSPSSMVVYDLATNKTLHTFQIPNNDDGSNWLRFSGNGETFALYHDNKEPKRREIQLWNTMSQTLISSIPCGDEEYALCLSPDGTLVASVSESRSPNNSTITLWHVPTGKQQQSFKGNFPMVFSADGKSLAYTFLTECSRRVYDTCPPQSSFQTWFETVKLRDIRTETDTVLLARLEPDSRRAHGLVP